MHKHGIHAELDKKKKKKKEKWDIDWLINIMNDIIHNPYFIILDLKRLWSYY